MVEVKKIRCRIFLFAIFIGIVAAPGLAKPEEVITLRYSTINQPVSGTYKRFDIPLAAEIEKRTNGKVKVEMFAAGVLSSNFQNYETIKSGLADFGLFGHAWLPGRFPLTDISALPFVTEDIDVFIKVMNELKNRGYFDKEWNEVKLMGFYPVVPYVVFFKKAKPMTVEDLKGMKVRTPGGVITKFLSNIGMVPVQVSMGDGYMSWDRGLIDAWCHAPSVAHLPLKLYNSGMRSLLEWNSNSFSGEVLFNLKKFNSLPADIQKTVIEVCQEFQYVWAESSRISTKEAYKAYKEHNVDIYKLPDSEMKKIYDKALLTWDDFIEQNEKKGLPARQLVNDFVELMKKEGSTPIYKIN